jgi:hypothetical protein
VELLGVTFFADAFFADAFFADAFFADAFFADAFFAGLLGIRVLAGVCVTELTSALFAAGNTFGSTLGASFVTTLLGSCDCDVAASAASDVRAPSDVSEATDSAAMVRPTATRRMRSEVFSIVRFLWERAGIYFNFLLSWLFLTRD